jgi:dolichol-phosphate mannosyltransferase
MGLQVDERSPLDASANGKAALTTSRRSLIYDGQVRSMLSVVEMETIRGPDLTVVVPTLNERDNLEPLLASVTAVLGDISWEVIFVDDDSSDGTADHARRLARENARVRCLQRIGRRGLATACVEGVLASASPYVAIMDGDLQHDERLLLHMLHVLEHEPVDVVVGSRYMVGGEIGEGLNDSRVHVSRFATWLAKLICKAEITDPMSGFFMCRREVFEQAVHHLSGQGFKILLDLMTSSSRLLRVRELPYEFRKRRYGESKLDVLVAWEYGMLLTDKLIGHVVPVRFALFALIGGSGLFIHIAVLWSGLKLMGLAFVAAQTIGTITAMTSNFFLNNLFTYRDRRLRGWHLVRGLFSFYLICSIGAVANVGIATYLFHADQTWWVAGVAGIMVGSVWNYAVSSVFTWNKHFTRRQRSDDWLSKSVRNKSFVSVPR